MPEEGQVAAEAQVVALADRLRAERPQRATPEPETPEDQGGQLTLDLAA